MQRDSQQGDIFAIRYDEKRLTNNKEKANYLFKLLKESNPLSKNNPKLTINDLLSNQLKFYLQEKQSICAKKTTEMKNLIEHIDNLQIQIMNQKQLTTKYYQKVQHFIEGIQSQTKDQLRQLTKERIQNEIQFAQMIDVKLQKLTDFLSQVQSETQQKHQKQWKESLKRVSDKILSLKKKQHDFNLQMTQNQTELLTQVTHRATQLRAMNSKLKSETGKLDLLLEEIQNFHKSIVSKIAQMKQQRVQKEQKTIQIIQQIISAFDKKNIQ